MKIYNVIQEDRHTDTTATPFLDLNEAIKFAKESARWGSRKYPEYYLETDIKGWLFFVRYSCEDDCIWITEHNI